MSWLSTIRTVTRPVPLTDIMSTTATPTGVDQGVVDGPQQSPESAVKEATITHVPRTASNSSRRGWIEGSDWDAARNLLKVILQEKVEKFIAAKSSLSTVSGPGSTLVDSDVSTSAKDSDEVWMQRFHAAISHLRILEPDDTAFPTVESNKLRKSGDCLNSVEKCTADGVGGTEDDLHGMDGRYSRKRRTRDSSPSRGGHTTTALASCAPCADNAESTGGESKRARADGSGVHGVFSGV